MTEPNPSLPQPIPDPKPMPATAGIRWSRLIGKLPKPSELLYGLGSGFPLVVGGFYLAVIYFGCLSTAAPEYVEGILNNDFFQLVSEGNHQSLINGLIALEVVILAPVCEEIVFRGFLFTRWHRKWGPGRAPFASPFFLR